MKKIKKGIHSPLHGQAGVHDLQESRVPYCMMATWEGKCHHFIFFIISSSQLLLLSMRLCGLECPFGQSGSTLPAASPPKSLLTPILLAAGAV